MYMLIPNDRGSSGHHIEISTVLASKVLAK
jgi:hypothetical protein